MSFSEPARPQSVRCLHLQAIAPGYPYHAALSATDGARARGFRISEHSHDFYEMIFVLAGSALHGINGAVTQLGAGDLILLRPGDRHYIRFETGRLLHYINIAMDANLWKQFHGLVDMAAQTDVPVVLSAMESAAGKNNGDVCEAAFRRALMCFQDKETAPALLRIEACLLLGALAPYLLGTAWHDAWGANPFDAAPPWLVAW